MSNVQMPLANFRLVSLATVSACLLAGAASAKEKTINPKNAPSQVGTVDSGGAYKLSAEEQGYDCKRLTGRMQVRLLQVRDYDPARKPSAFSQGVRSAADPVASVLLGKSAAYGSDPSRQRDNDIAMLRAYNAQLAAKKCKTFNLDAELAAGNKGSPLPSVQPKGK